MRLLITAAAAAALCLSSPALAVEPDAAAAPAVAVVRDGDRWTAEFELNRDAPVWVFADSETVAEGRGWRLGQWQVETAGVELATVDGRDVLRAVGEGRAVPRRVRIRLAPRFVDLQASYDPILAFSTGAVAMFSESFNLLPLDAPAALAALPRDLEQQVEAAGFSVVTWRDMAGPVLFRGERQASATAARAGTYVLFGEADVRTSDALATVVDPGLPGWIAAEVGGFAPQVAEHYARRIGPGAPGTSTVMMSWSGPEPGAASMAGSVLPQLVVMAFWGDGVVEPSPRARDMARWFIGHESAHFWLGQTVRYDSPLDSWITEGGADLMAIRAIETIDPAYSGDAPLQAAVDDCIRLADEPVETSVDRGEFRAQYACGAVFALVAEAAQRRATGGDWFDFLRTVIDASREDGVVTRADWLGALDRVSGDPGLRTGMETLLGAGAADPAVVVASLLEGSGVGFSRAADGLSLD